MTVNFSLIRSPAPCPDCGGFMRYQKSKACLGCARKRVSEKCQQKRAYVEVPTKKLMDERVVMAGVVFENVERAFI